MRLNFFFFCLVDILEYKVHMQIVLVYNRIENSSSPISFTFFFDIRHIICLFAYTFCITFFFTYLCSGISLPCILTFVSFPCLSTREPRISDESQASC